MPKTPNLEAQVDGPQYLGPGTFMKVRMLTEPAELDELRPDVAIVGAPWDDSTTHRPGARFGPRAVRVANYQPPSWHLDLEVAPFEVLSVVDYGDAVCYPGRADQAHEAMRAQRMRWHLMGELLDRGVETVVEQAIQEALDGPEFIYLSVDIDVLDPGFAPGTGTPEPGGMQPADLLRAIRKIALRTKLVGMDVVEVSPPSDHAEITAQNANRCILDAISALAVKQSRGGKP